MKLGIIQTRGLGDIVIAAPIAAYYNNRGFEVFWPIDSDFISSFKDAFPKINFIPIEKTITGDATADYFYHQPLRELNKIGCEITICLYSYLSEFDLGNKRLQESLSFDAYKYAIAKVPFKEKWNLKIKRNVIREAKMFDLLNIDPAEEFVVIHDEGSNAKVNIQEKLIKNNKRLVRIEPITDNIFDWLGVIECSNSLYLLDSVYANLVEQLNLENTKTLYLRSQAKFSPVFINSWTML
jgi:hypothetical protein